MTFDTHSSFFQPWSALIQKGNESLSQNQIFVSYIFATLLLRLDCSSLNFVFQLLHLKNLAYFVKGVRFWNFINLAGPWRRPTNKQSTGCPKKHGNSVLLVPASWIPNLFYIQGVPKHMGIQWRIRYRLFYELAS